MILIRDEEVRGIEKSRNKYYLDETEAHRGGKGKLVSFRSQFWTFGVGVCVMMSFNTEVAIK